MSRYFSPILLFCGFLLFSLSGQAQCYELFWSDEFSYTGHPDPNVWTHESGGGGFGNNEIQYYKANDLDNAKVENGLLTITALKESYGGRDYTSARLITKGKFGFQYGKIEARIRTPYGQGIWPAFWMMGENISEVGWPACGEIDVLELIGGGEGRDNRAHGTAHWDSDGSHASHGSGITLDSGIFADTFHVFSLEWTPTLLTWYMDDIKFHALSITSSRLSEFHQNFFLLLNLAIGGNWPGYPDETTVFPQSMEVDYVRVYKSSADMNSMEVLGDNNVAQKESGIEFSMPYSLPWTYEWSVPEDAEILSGQDSSTMILNWGCTDGEVSCRIIGECDTFIYSKEVLVESSIHGPMFVAENEDNVLFHVDSLAESSIEWMLPEDTEIESGQGTDSIFVKWGETFEAISVKIINACGEQTLSFEPIKTGQYPYPDLITAHSIPGKLNATDFDYGGQGVSYKDVSAGNSGDGPREDTDVDTEYKDGGIANVGWISNGEWLEYTIEVDSSSYYDIEARVATDNSSGGPFSLWFNENELLTGPKISNTGGWDQFISLEIGRVYLTPEDTILRINFDTGGFNLGEMTFIPYAEPIIDTVSVDNRRNHIGIFPNPARSKLEITSVSNISECIIYDLNGREAMKFKDIGEYRLSIDISSMPAGLHIIKISTDSGNRYYEKLLISSE